MCLTTTDPNIKVAESNIVVYKGNREGIGLMSFRAYMYDSFAYDRFNKTRDVNLVPVAYTSSLHIVEEGYHAYVNREDCDHEYVGIFIIPKGAKYIEGFNNDTTEENTVSSSLIYIGRCNFLTRLIQKIFYR